MLKTKDDINAQKGKLTQLTIEEEKPKKTNLLQKPSTIHITFIVTLVLSCLLWLISEIKQGIHLPSFKISIPQIKLPISDAKPQNLDQLISKDIDLNNGLWSFYIYSDNIDYQKNINQFKLPLSDLKTDLQNLPSSNTSLAQDILPQGLQIIENLDEQSQIINYQLLVGLPTGKQFFVFIKSSNPQDIFLAKTQISQVVPNLYRQLIQLD